MAIKNQIYIGSLNDPSYYFENTDILSANVVQNVALVGQELSIDTFTPVVQDDLAALTDAYHFRSADGQEIVCGAGELYAIDVDPDVHASGLISLEYGTPVWFYQDNTLVGKFYIESVRRTAANAYQLNTVSAIGLLESKNHGGGLFMASTFGDVLEHILATGLHGEGDPVIDYEIDDDVAELPVSCWLPRATKRDNLYQLVFANGVNILKNIDGNPRFTFIYTAPEQAQEIDAEIQYDEGNVEYTQPYEKVVVLEHTYTEILTESPITLFDNAGGIQVSNKEVWFDQAPIIVSTITATGLTLISANENSAIVSGNGSLTGIPYLHSTRSIEIGNHQADEKKTVSVNDCTAVNMINSENLLNRLYAFYCPQNYIKKISGCIVYTDERCGKAYSMLSPFREHETSFMSSMNITVSAINKADCEWYADYVPAGQAGLYQHVIVLDKETFEEDGGTFTVPDGVEEMKVIIIGGGTGGGSGWPGANGDDATCYTEVESTADLSAVWYGAEGGDGGAGGSGGAPGRVKVVTIQNPDASYSYTIGTGGEGGAATGFRPDTVAELRAALENENPDTSYTDQELEALIAQESTTWNGTPNAGSAGTASTFGSYSSADNDGYVPTGGVYEPITDQYFALAGNAGIKGGKGGARKVQSGSTFNWVTDGEDVTGDDGTVYRGGSTGRMLTDVAGLPEAAGKIKAYGGNGAGAAVGIGRDIVTPQTGLLLHPHINGGSDQETDWDIVQDEN